jgi:hypothetical protein
MIPTYTIFAAGALARTGVALKLVVGMTIKKTGLA